MFAGNGSIYPRPDRPRNLSSRIVTSSINIERGRELLRSISIRLFPNGPSAPGSVGGN